MKIPSFVWVVGFLVVGGIFLLALRPKPAEIKEGTLPVQVEVFSDYNCPHCADFSPFVDEVITTFGDKVKVDLKQSPFLASTSNTYAYAAEAARVQGKFSEYNHSLFAWASFLRDNANTNFTYSEEDKPFYSQEIDVTKLAERLGLDVAKFELDRKSSAVVNSVLDQKSDLAKRMNSVSTPAVFIYGQLFEMKTYNDLKAKVQELITAAESKQNETK